ncbi:type II toxin-antitoxin system RelE/ParE family toxin [Neopusillimonas maritima]|uniref:Addiction module toxin RelE n=1 Tax=Neopusillimonas maritima TaxID=2026239 RepID=A0ABX9MX25_9BURK|nr:type II toxin-antitoxin system RelE/ParE family toxin [Neopusillimonas maritima]RII83473.1 hypothetical protein CJO09_07730 [Neopusillimonas maritima]
MVRIFKTRHFSRWALKAGIHDKALTQAIDEMILGLSDANLGGSVFKKRLPAPGRGKRGGFRTLIATRSEQYYFFVFGFEKNKRSNVTTTELQALQALAIELLSLTEHQIIDAVEDGAIQEIMYDAENKKRHS